MLLFVGLKVKEYGYKPWGKRAWIVGVNNIKNYNVAKITFQELQDIRDGSIPKMAEAADITGAFGPILEVLSQFGIRRRRNQEIRRATERSDERSDERSNERSHERSNEAV